MGEDAEHFPPFFIPSTPLSISVFVGFVLCCSTIHSAKMPVQQIK